MSNTSNPIFDKLAYPVCVIKVVVARLEMNLASTIK
jgi:hypothetical protein